MTESDSPPILRRLLLFAGGILVAASVTAAVITSLDTGSSAELLRVRLLLTEGLLNEAEQLLDSLEPFSQSDLPAARGVRRDLGLARERERRLAEQQAALTIARTAAEDGRLQDAVEALSGAAGLDQGLAQEVGEALLDQAKHARRAWDHEEARRLLDLARRAFGEEDETALIEAEFLIEKAEHLDERSELLLEIADNAMAEGELERAEEALFELRTGGFSPKARAEAEQRSAVLEAQREARDRTAVLTKLNKLLDQGQVSASRELLELHARVTGSREFDSRIAALKELEEAGGATSFLPVRNALRFLVKCQDQTGGFTLSGYQQLFPRDKVGGSWQAHYDLGITGLALLAFTAFRHLDIRGEFDDPAARCAKFLVMSVPRTGSVSGNHYNHAIVALALLERTLAIGQDRSRAEFKAAGLIINYLTRRAQLPDGGWRYTTRFLRHLLGHAGAGRRPASGHRDSPRRPQKGHELPGVHHQRQGLDGLHPIRTSPESDRGRSARAADLPGGGA